MAELKWPRPEVAVIPDNCELEILLGEKTFITNVFSPYDENIINFLSEISIKIFENPASKQYPDLISFAFWIRKSNLLVNKKNKLNHNSIGLGLAFHIPPSNIPLNFAYSFVFGLLSGNSNIIRVPSKKNFQTKFLINLMKKILDKKIYLKIKKTNLFIRYDHNDLINRFYSKNADCRLIWGGDKTIKKFREYSTKTTSIDIMFPDKYSFSVINSDYFKKINKVELRRLVENFYNDTYLFDQNACSAPHLIVWTGNNFKEAKNIFWKKLHSFLKLKYQYNYYVSIKKYNVLLKNLIKAEYIEYQKEHSNLIFRIGLKNLVKELDQLKGFAGIFFEYETNNLKSLKKVVNRRYQTLLYFGMDKKELKDIVINNNFRGIDRIVPIGNGLDMNLIWDGYKLDDSLSRIIDIK